MARKDTDKQINITLSEDEDKEIREFCKEHKITLNEAFRKARGLLLTDALKAKAPDQAAQIDDLLAHQSAINDLFRTVIEHGLNAKSIAEREVKGQLEGMSKLMDRNAELSREVETLQSERDSLRSEYSSLRSELDSVRAQAMDAEKLRSERNSMYNEITELKEKIADLRKTHSEEIAELHDETWKKLLEVVRVREKTR